MTDERDGYAEVFDAVLAALEGGESEASVEDAINAAYEAFEEAA